MLKNKGYWQVKDELFENKILAILSAQKQNLGPEGVSFHYNDEWWDRADWSKEPTESLDDLYLKRALGLRSKYKKLILRLSGGADSMNILKLFVEHNIKLDAIAVNTYSEAVGIPKEQHKGSWEKINIVAPYLDELSKQGYEFERFEIDTSRFFSLVTEPNWFLKYNIPRLRMTEFQAPRTVLHPALAKYDSPDTCIISGIDKPWVWCLEDKIWYFSMPDSTSVLVDQHNNIVQEPFYWTADMPELVIKQSHAVKNYFQSHLDQYPKVSNNLAQSLKKNLLVPLIYPRYYKFTPGDPLPYLNVENTPTNGVVDGVCEDGYENNPIIYQAHQQGIDQVDQMLNPEFKDRGDLRKHGIKNIYSKKRWLGK
jgi:hypothetical protein